MIRDLSHTQAIMSAVGDKGGKKVVVIGSSFIGMEVGNALAGKKHDVTVVGMESVPLERVMGKQVGAVFRALLEKSGVKFHMDASVESGAPSSSDSSKIGSVELKDGTSLPADVVILGVGVRPATDYLKDSSVNLEKDGSLLVDEHFLVKGQKDVYAVGDIAKFPYHGPGGQGSPVRIEHWDVAQNSGRAVAAHITSATKGIKSARDFVPVFWSAVGSQLRYCGNTVNGWDDVVVQGKLEADGPAWVAYYAKGDEIVAVASMMKDPYVAQSVELMRMRAMPGKKEIESGKDILQVAIPAR